MLPGYWQQTTPARPRSGRRGRARRHAGPPRGRRPRPGTPCWRCTATPTTSSTPSWPTTSPTAASRSTRSTCTSAAGRGGTGQTPHFTTDLARYDARTGPGAGADRRPTTTAGARVLRVRPLRGRADRRRCGWIGCAHAARSAARASAGWCSTARSSTCTGPAILRTAPTSAALIALARLAQAARSIRKPTARRLRHQPAPRLRRRVRLRPRLEAARRVSRHLRLDQRDPARSGPAAPRARRRRAEPDPALGPQRSRVARSRGHPARRRGARRRADRALGRLRRQPHDDRADRRRQARRVPVAGRAARGGLPRAGPLAGRLPELRESRERQHESGQG